MSDRQYESPEFLEPPIANDRFPLTMRLAALTAAATLLTGANMYMDNRREEKAQAQAQDVAAIVADQQDRIAELEDQLDRVTDLAVGGTGFSDVAVLGEGLADVTGLDTYDALVSNELRNQLRGATVQLLKKPAGSDEWKAYCSGLMLSHATETYVVTADHCFNTVGGKGGGTGENPPAINITGSVPDEYMVVPAGSGANALGGAEVQQISISTENDIALLEVDFAGASLTPQYAVNSNSYISQLPEGGLQTVSFGMPDAAIGGVVEGKGVYLGPHKLSEGQERYIDIVGLTNADLPAADACNFGASGSGAMLSNGRLMGPLSVRWNVGYGEGRPAVYPDDMGISSRIRMLLEAETGYDLSQFNTICGYTSMHSNVIPDLVEGFDNY